MDLTSGATDDEIRRFQAFLTDYTIVIYNRRNGRDVKFQGPVAPEYIVLIMRIEDTFDYITTFSTMNFKSSRCLCIIKSVLT